MAFKVYRLKADDARMGLSEGDLLLCGPYDHDPGKVSVICRLSDGFRPECNQYKAAVRLATDDEVWESMWN